jgi:hypothetical protein
VPDDATEVLVRAGRVTSGVAEIDLLVVDMRGHVHQGRLQRGANPVCITFDLVLTRDTGTVDQRAPPGPVCEAKQSPSWADDEIASLRSQQPS